MHTLRMLAYHDGPRVTGTPNHEAAARWVIDETTRWGFKNPTYLFLRGPLDKNWGPYYLPRMGERQSTAQREH